jgi:hypothetical protein
MAAAYLPRLLAMIEKQIERIELGADAPWGLDDLRGLRVRLIEAQRSLPRTRGAARRRVVLSGS